MRLLYTTALLAGIFCATPPATPQGLNLDGSPAEMEKLARGKVLVLVFVRTDCSVSNRYAPTVQELSRKYAGEAVFYLVFPSKAESAETIKEYLKSYGYTLEALRDPEHALVEKSAVKVTPEAAVFDAGRRLVYHGRINNLYVEFAKARRAATTHELADAIEAAHAGKRPPVEAAAGIGCFIADLK
jgi:thiol-disulfide isomerase/thioredoxin